MLELKNIQKSFGGVHAVQGSYFSVEKGKITALIGPNGAGKTTLFDIIGGYIVPDKGEILFHNDDITELRPDERANLGISRTFQQVRLFHYLTIGDHLDMVADHEDTKVFGQLLRGVKKQTSYKKLLDEYGIERSADAPVSDLSYGQRKLLNIAMAIKKPHQLLMLDEPVAGVNAVVQERIENLLKELKEKGETMLLIDHDMQFVRSLADHVIVLDAGVVLTQGDPDTVLSDPRVLEAYLGE